MEVHKVVAGNSFEDKEKALIKSETFPVVRTVAGLWIDPKSIGVV